MTVLNVEYVYPGNLVLLIKSIIDAIIFKKFGVISLSYSLTCLVILEIPFQDFVLRENLANRQKETSIKCFQEYYPQQQKPGSHLKATGGGWRWRERYMNKLCNCHAKE